MVIAETWMREQFSPLLGKTGVWLNNHHVKAWQITLLALLFGISSGVAAGFKLLFLSALLFTLAGLLDVVDGSVARSRGSLTRHGAFVDSVLDRVVDASLLLGLMWFAANQDQMLAAWLLAVSIMLVLLSSYIRARAETLGGGGPANGGRVERVILFVAVLLVLAIFPSLSLIISIILVGFSLLAAVLRWRQAWLSLVD